MAITDKTGINVASGFKLVAPVPIDARFIAADETDLQSFITNNAAYKGLTVWVDSLGKSMVYNGTEFVPVASGSTSEGSVSTEHIADGAVTTNKLSEDIQDTLDQIGTIDEVLDEINGGGTASGGGSVEIPDGSVTEEKLSDEVREKVDVVQKEEIDGLGIVDIQGNIGLHVASKNIWENMPYNRKYGFGGMPWGNGELPPLTRLAGVFEADMLSVSGGKGRWNSEDTGNFKHGGHVFEGWNKEEDVRLTFGIGLNNKNIAWIQTFHPATEEGTDGGAYYGITKIGSDLDGQGCNFLPSVTMAQSPFVLWNRPTDYAPQINEAQLNLLIESGEIPDYMTNSNDKMIVGAMYYDTTLDRVRVYTKKGWKTLKFEED